MFIKQYYDVVPEEQCNMFMRLIDEADKHEGVSYNPDDFTKPYVVDHSRKRCMEVIFEDTYPMYVNQIVDITNKSIIRYCKDLNLRWAPFHETEALIGRYYQQGKGVFKEHIDCGPDSSIARTLVVLICLNTVEEGGEVYFPLQDIAVQPIKGSVIIFPTMWTHPHEGRSPLSSPKYTLKTFIRTKVK